jgi:anti-anti-sigma factor
MSYLAAFRVTIESIEDACLVRVAGELDATRAADLRTHLRDARRAANTTLVDVADVSFIDSTGLRALLDETRVGSSSGHATFITRPSSVVRRLIEITGSGDRLAVVPGSRDLSRLHSVVDGRVGGCA